LHAAVAKDAKNCLFLTKGTSADNYSGASASLHKSERLCRKQLIASLFEAGHRFLAPPLQIIWMYAALDAPVPAQSLFSVSARKFPHATDRNRIKRVMRETYRRNKSSLYDVLQQEKLQIAIAFIYTGRSLTTFNDLEPKIQVALNALTQKVIQQRS